MSHAASTSADSQLPSREPLSRQLGVVSLVAQFVGLAIGSGIFRVPSTVAAQIGSVGGIAIIWLAGAAVAIAGALPIIAMTTALPRTGGSYVFLREAYGPLVGFLYGWVKMLVTGPAGMAAFALVFAEYIRAFAPLTDGQVHLVAGGLILALTAAHVRSVPWGVALQVASTAAKVLALAVLAVLIFALGNSQHGAFAHPVAWSGVSTSSFFAALIGVLWTYSGWNEFTYLAGEVKDPVRTYPRAFLIGIAIILSVYLVINAAYLYVLPVPVIAKSTLVAATAAAGPLGSRGAAFVAGLVMLSTFGALNASIMASPRVWYAMANDGLLFRRHRRGASAQPHTLCRSAAQHVPRPRCRIHALVRSARAHLRARPLALPHARRRQRVCRAAPAARTCPTLPRLGLPDRSRRVRVVLRGHAGQ